jgi:SAM-dependent methyltransferase
MLEQEVLYSQLTLFNLLAYHINEFDTILDIGSAGGNVATILRFLGKKATTCEVGPGHTADFKSDFIETRFGTRFDAIWCSQVLEHQRNPGFFLNKVFDDLNDGGLLALTVPAQVGLNLDFGHCNMFSPLSLIYHLVMAGFDCREIELKVYDGNIGVILRKKYNGIDRSLPMGTLPLTDKTAGVRETLGKEVFDGMADCFPAVIRVDHSTTWPDIDAIGWK